MVAVGQKLNELGKKIESIHLLVNSDFYEIGVTQAITNKTKLKKTVAEAQQKYSEIISALGGNEQVLMT